MTIDSKALEACPFCGAEAYVEWNRSTGSMFSVQCTRCAAEGPINAVEAEAIAAWNRRALPSPKVEGELVRYEIIDHTGCIHYANDAEHAEKLRQTLVHPSPVLADEGVVDKARLLERVRAATGPDREIDAAFWALTHGTPFRFVGQRVEMEFRHADEQTKRWHKSHDTRDVAGAVVGYVPYTSSLDAIVALIDTQFGDGFTVEMTLTTVGKFKGHAKCAIWWGRESDGQYQEGNTRALACCAAFLFALSAQEDKL